MLDTNACIAIMTGRSERAVRRLTALEVGDVGLSAVTVAELEFGIAKSLQAQRNREMLGNFMLPLKVAAFDEPAARAYGAIRATLEASGRPIGPLDTMIAGHALALGATLVTNNVREFSRIPGLAIANWMGRG